MTSTNTSNLPAAATLDGTELLPIVQSGNSRRTTIADALASLTALRQAIDPAEIYPSGIGPTGNAGLTTRTPASLGYSTIADYVAALPPRWRTAAMSFSFCTPLVTDECDWIAWIAACNYIYDNFGTTFATGCIATGSHYRVNRTIVINGDGIRIEGLGQGSRFGGASITATSTMAGTIDAPIAIIDCYAYDEFYFTPGGRLFPSASSGSNFQMRHMIINGAGGNMFANSSSPSNYVTGVRLRQNNGSVIEDCVFGGTLYDGILCTGASLWTYIQKNYFYAVHRDAVSWQPFAIQYSTTMTIRDNYFGFGGRYAIFLGLTDAIVPMPKIINNIFEPVYQSFFWSNPEWYVHGVRACCCFIGCGYMEINGNYIEGVTGGGADDSMYHFVECVYVQAHQDPAFGLPYVTSMDPTGRRSTAAIAYWNDPYVVTGISKANPMVATVVGHPYVGGETIHFYRVGGGGGFASNPSQVFGPAFTVTVVDADHVSLGVDSSAYTGTFSTGARITKGTLTLDITDTRNFLVASLGQVGVTSTLYTTDCAIGKIFFADQISLDITDITKFDNAQFTFWTTPTALSTARNGRKVTPLDTTIPTYRPTSSRIELTNCSTNSVRYSKADLYSGTSDYVISGPTAAPWTAATAYHPTFTQNYYWLARQLIQPTDANFNGLVYQCVLDGTSHATTEPTWPTAVATNYAVTAITKAATAVVTAPGHDFVNGQKVMIQSGDMTQVIGVVFTVAGVSGNTFQLSGINSSGYTTYTAAAQVFRVIDDNTTAWRCVAGGAYLSSDNNIAERREFNMRRRQTFGNTAPTTGVWTQGDMVINRLPDAGGGASPYYGWICTAGNGLTVGTWKTWGPVSA